MSDQPNKPATSREVNNLLNLSGLYRRKVRRHFMSLMNGPVLYDLYQVHRQRSPAPKVVIFEMAVGATLEHWMDAIRVHVGRKY